MITICNRHQTKVSAPSLRGGRGEGLLLLLLLLSFVSCSSDDEAMYPPIITEPMMVSTNAAGSPVSILTDAGISYQLLNRISGWPQDTVLRIVGGYVVENGQARLYDVQNMYVLHDCSHLDTIYRHPTNVESVWLGGGFINMHLLPKTQGGKQRWGFLRDSTRTNTLGGTTHHISLFHDQADDPTAYSGHLYCCIPLDSIAYPRTSTDSIILAIPTMKATLAFWHF